MGDAGFALALVLDIAAAVIIFFRLVIHLGRVVLLRHLGLNFVNNPKVFIDRVTGTISISGKAGDFTGQCQAMDPSAPAKF